MRNMLAEEICANTLAEEILLFRIGKEFKKLFTKIPKLLTTSEQTRHRSNVALSLVKNSNYLAQPPRAARCYHARGFFLFSQRLDDVVFENFSHSTPSKTLRQQEGINDCTALIGVISKALLPRRSVHILFERENELCRKFHQIRQASTTLL